MPPTTTNPVATPRGTRRRVSHSTSGARSAAIATEIRERDGGRGSGGPPAGPGSITIPNRSPAARRFSVPRPGARVIDQHLGKVGGRS